MPAALRWIGIIALGYGLVLYLSLAYWAFKDARDRSTGIGLPLFAFLANAMFPLLGLLIYVLIRPRETVGEIEEREAEMTILSWVEEEPPKRLCPVCSELIDEAYVTCPYCETPFSKVCGECGKRNKLAWQICPWCGAGHAPKRPKLRIHAPGEPEGF